MQRIAILILLLGGSLVASDRPSAYETPTHGLITFDACRNSRILLDPLLLANLGLRSSGANTASHYPGLGKIYVDVFGAQTIARKQYDYEYNSMPNVNPTGGANYDGFNRDANRSEVPGWLLAGAIREDDNPTEGPNDDPYVTSGTPPGTFHREFNHFFDPAKNQPLTVGFSGVVGQVYARAANGVRTIRRAPDWALGVDDALSTTMTHGSDTLNHFTVLDAREAMWRALTLKRLAGSGPLIDIPYSWDFNIPGPARLRQAYWATTFRALGDVLHMNQDMAQPQHTRNEPHSGYGWDPVQSYITGHTSVIEKYAQARTRGDRSFSLAGVALANDQPLEFAAYPLPAFNRYSDYWSTGLGALSLQGNGLADYSNRGFFTAANNFDGSTYTSPSTSIANYSIQTTSVDFLGTPGIKQEYFWGDVKDTLNPNVDHIRMTARGLYRDVLDRRGFVTVASYTLDAQIYDDQLSLLIPRAVAYSAGILNYFFRGQLQIDLPDEGTYAILDNATPICYDLCGFNKIKLKLTNATPQEAMTSGVLVAVAKFHRNYCYVSDLSGDPGGRNFAGDNCRSVEEEIVVSNAVNVATLTATAGRIPSGTQVPLSFDFPSPIPINATDLSLQVVFRGALGNEPDTVVVATKDISEPTYIAFENDVDYSYNGSTDKFTAVPPDSTTQTFGRVALTLGTATTPIATIPQLSIRGYAQLVMLADRGTERLTFDFVNPTASSFPSPFKWDLDMSTFYAVNGDSQYTRSSPVALYRGVYRDFARNYFGGNSYQTGIAACAPGDTRAICTSAGLTAVTAANAVRWTIAFP